MMELFKKYDGSAETKMPLCQQRHSQDFSLVQLLTLSVMSARFRH
ncbi:hypothetical protein [Morganella morganii]|nr:hypothetical protein [Morganella morganii]